MPQQPKVGHAQRRLQHRRPHEVLVAGLCESAEHLRRPAQVASTVACRACGICARLEATIRGAVAPAVVCPGSSGRPPGFCGNRVEVM
eukprot:6385345-Lingulodinium_polyedra.AAC.1